MTSILSTAFLNSYRSRSVNWGFPSGPNFLGELVYRRTYRRDSERWMDTVARVVEGTFEIVARHCKDNGLDYPLLQYRLLAEEMYERIFSFKFTPPGRGLWMMGTDYVRNRTGMGLFNCAFTSTQNLHIEGSVPFRFLMDLSMLGVGVGFDVRGAGKASWQPRMGPVEHWDISDDREGWVESTGRIIDWGLGRRAKPQYSYSGIRGPGVLIKGFGGLSSGPEPLMELHNFLFEMIEKNDGKAVGVRDIVDIGNVIGRTVVSGNVRRTAEIVFGEPDDETYLDLKNYEKYPERAGFGWASNNSIFARVGMDYTDAARRTEINGEPGYAWLENMQKYGRMKDPADWKDILVMGGNPCVTADTLVMTDIGQRQVGELIGQPFMAMVNSKPYHASGFWSTGVKSVYRLSTTDGYGVRLTANHKVKVARSGELVWVEAGQLEQGDDIVLNNHGDFPFAPVIKHRLRVFWADEPVYLSPFLSLEYDGEEEVFDCIVDVVHEFDANGIAVHNCLEQSLEDKEVCNLVEEYPSHHDSLEDFKFTSRCAWFYAKAVTLVHLHWPETLEINRRNRRIGCSQSGVVQAIQKLGEKEYWRWCDETYEYLCEEDRGLSKAWNVNESIKKTSTKPSGTVSLLSGVKPGVHWDIYSLYIRRVRYASNHPDLQALRNAGYPVEPAIVGYADYATQSGPIYDHGTMVVEIPVDASSDGLPTQNEVSLRQKVQLAANIQYWWADNQVSCTASFRPEEGKEIAPLLSEFDSRLKGISFLPIREQQYYPQMPYEAISREEYDRRVSLLSPVVWPKEASHADDDKGCDGQACEAKLTTS